jgi:YfiH family protein
MIQIVQSKLFLDNGIAIHGFTTRLGGHSRGPFACANFSFDVGDDPGDVQRNLERLKDQYGTSLPLLRARQVHGKALIHAVDLLVGNFDGWSSPPDVEADAVLGRAGEGMLAVATADCVPLLLADTKAAVCAAVHAGWRGLKAKVVRAAVRGLCALGAEPSEMIAVIGPRICEACYEVGPEVAACFPESSDPLRNKDNKYSLDIGNDVEVSLIAAGLRGNHIEVLPLCTCCDAERFYSHRRDNGCTGRHLGFVAL